MAKSLNEVGKKKELPPIRFKPTNPARGVMPHADAVEDNKRIKAANLAADEAYKKAMQKQAPEKDIKVIEKDNLIIVKKQLLVSLGKQMKELQDELNDAGQGETRPIKMQMGKLNKKIEAVEVELAELQK